MLHFQKKQNTDSRYEIFYSGLWFYILFPTQRTILKLRSCLFSSGHFQRWTKCAQAEAAGLASPLDGKIFINIHLSCWEELSILLCAKWIPLYYIEYFLLGPTVGTHKCWEYGLMICMYVAINAVTTQKQVWISIVTHLLAIHFVGACLCPMCWWRWLVAKFKTHSCCEIVKVWKSNVGKCEIETLKPTQLNLYL